MKEYICYKVVTLNHKSIIAENTDAEVQYIQDQWVTAQTWIGAYGYGLMAFTYERCARRFYEMEAGFYNDLQIWKCLGKEQMPLKPRLGQDDLYKKYTWRIENTLESHNPHVTYQSHYPDGTISFQQIKLVDELKPSVVEHY